MLRTPPRHRESLRRPPAATWAAAATWAFSHFNRRPRRPAPSPLRARRAGRLSPRRPGLALGRSAAAAGHGAHRRAGRQARGHAQRSPRSVTRSGRPCRSRMPSSYPARLAASCATAAVSGLTLASRSQPASGQPSYGRCLLATPLVAASSEFRPARRHLQREAQAQCCAGTRNADDHGAGQRSKPRSTTHS